VLAAMEPDHFAMPDGVDAVRTLADEIARALLDAKHPLIISGTSCGRPALMEAAANLAWFLKRRGRPAELAMCVPECNSLGLSLMDPRDLEAALQAVDTGRADTLVILENDLYRRIDAERVDALLEKARHVIVIDHLSSETTANADLVLPAATFADASGTLINNEGRAQRGHAVMPPPGAVRASWRWLRMLMAAAGQPGVPAWSRLVDVVADLAREMPVFEPVAELDPEVAVPTPAGKIPRQSHRYTGRTAMRANIDVSEPKPPVDEDSPLAFSMEGYDGRPPAGLIARNWAPGWNSEQALNKFQSEIGGPLRGGDSGRRLIEPAPVDDGRYFSLPGPAAPLESDEVLVVPVRLIFGSDVLSMASPAIAERAPQPYLALSPQDAPVEDGQPVEVHVEGHRLKLPVKRVPGLPGGVAGLPAGLPGLPTIALPTAGTIRAGSTKDGPP
jgi:NADH-quinone oxidoreductase subunit G